MTLIGMTEEDLQYLQQQAFIAGYKKCKAEEEAAKWLNGRDAIIDFLSAGSRRMAVRTFNDHRRLGHFGDAVVGVGTGMRANREALRAAWYQYQRTQY